MNATKETLAERPRINPGSFLSVYPSYFVPPVIPTGGRTMLYDLDVCAPNKVLNIEWDAQGNVVLVSLRPGAWEAELIALAKSVADGRDETVAGLRAKAIGARSN